MFCLFWTFTSGGASCFLLKIGVCCRQEITPICVICLSNTCHYGPPTHALINGFYFRNSKIIFIEHSIPFCEMVFWAWGRLCMFYVSKPNKHIVQPCTVELGSNYFTINKRHIHMYVVFPYNYGYKSISCGN